jgi:hypothetical protein
VADRLATQGGVTGRTPMLTLSYPQEPAGYRQEAEIARQSRGRETPPFMAG